MQIHSIQHAKQQYKSFESKKTKEVLQVAKKLSEDSNACLTLKAKRQAERIKTLIEKGFNNEQIAEQLHLKPKTIQVLRSQFGLPSEKELRNNTQKKIIQERLRAGIAINDIAKEFNTTMHKIRSIREECGIPSRTQINRENRAKFIIEKINEGLSTEEIAKILKITPQAVCHNCRSVNIDINALQKKSFNQRIKTMVEKGLAKEDITKELGITLNTLKLHLKNLEIPSDSILRRQSQLDFIKNKLEAGLTQKEIAEQLGLHYQTVCSIINSQGLNNLSKNARDKKILDFVAQNYTKEEIAKALNVHEVTIKRALKRLGITLPQSPQTTSTRKTYAKQRPRKEHLKELIEQGFSNEQIAQEMGLKITTIRSLRSQYGFPSNTETQTKKNAAIILEKLKSGLSRKEIAQEMGISDVTVGNYYNRLNPPITKDNFLNQLNYLKNTYIEFLQNQEKPEFIQKITTSINELKNFIDELIKK